MLTRVKIALTVRMANRVGAALLIAALLTLIFVAWVFLTDADQYRKLNAATDNVHAIIDTTQTALSALKDAETGQRGFVLTGDEAYLQPYSAGLTVYDAAMARLRSLTGSEASVQSMDRWGTLKKIELAAVIRLMRENGDVAARQRIRAGVGKEYMDQFRAMAAQLSRTGEALHAHNSLELDQSEIDKRVKVSVAAVVLFLFTLAGTLLLAAEIRNEKRIAAHLEISEKKYRDLAENLEHQVEARTETLQRVNSELVAFSYSVSHDLRAPLRSIDGFSQIVLEDYSDKLDDAGRDMLQRVRASAKRMGELIQSLLKLSRVTQTEPERQKFSLSTLAESVLGALAAADPMRGVKVNVQPGLTIQADPQLMRIVMDNLLGNAWKFTARTENARIDVGAEESRGKMAHFVRDNGAGFDSERADRLFTPFQRLHTEAEFDGTGIGLATVQRIINRHNGSIWAEAKPGEGATFFFTV